MDLNRLEEKQENLEPKFTVEEAIKRDFDKALHLMKNFSLCSDKMKDMVELADFVSAQYNELLAMHDRFVPVPLQKYTISELKELVIVGTSTYSNKQLRDVIDLKDMLVSLHETIKVITYKSRRKGRVLTQSETVGAMSLGTAATTDTSQTFTDMGGESIITVDAGASASTSVGASNVHSLDKFFARPVEIFRDSWALGTHKDIQLGVWDAYVTQPSIIAKLRNYAYFRGDLHVRISMSGTPFHYGQVLISYQPFPGSNAALTAVKDRLTFGAGNLPLYLNYLSQAPGSCIMNVRDNQPQDVVCPYIVAKPLLSLYNDSAVVVTSFNEFLGLGDLHLASINELRSASPGTISDVSIQVYAWVENIQLGTNTGTQVVVTTESESMEMKIGPVERWSSKISSVAMTMQGVPVLGRFATATSIAAGAFAKVAAIFGWSRPVLTDNVSRMRNLPYADTASTIGNSVARRIVLDPQQELDVSGEAVAARHDDLVISNIAARRSYLRTFTWDTDDVAMGTSIYNCKVHPNLCSVFQGTRAYVQPTAMAFAVQPFEFWRGDITFRFEFVCSAFHRGKVAIYYEPNNAQYTLINSDLSLNKQYIKIVDIQQTQVVEFKVNWASSREWLRNMTAQQAVANTVLDSPAFLGVGYCNGYIGVVPFTSLQSPTGEGIEVNVYVYSDNLHVNGLTSRNMPSQRIVNESENCNLASPIESNDLNDSTASDSMISQHYFGEEPVSFRSILKRYNLQRVVPVNTVTDSQGISISQPIMPEIQLVFDSTYSQPLAILSYLRYAYLGYRGGIRYLIATDASFKRSPISPVFVSLSSPSNTDSTAVSLTTIFALPQSSVNGMDLEIPSTNGGIEVEFPYYSNNLFSFSFNNTTDEVNANSNYEPHRYRNFNVEIRNLEANSGCTTYLYSSTGEDFSLLRFQGAPYYSANSIA